MTKPRIRWRLFFGLLWRQWEPKSCGIPDPYRIKHRITLREALEIAKEKP